MKLSKDEFIQSMNASKKQIEFIYSLNEDSKEFLMASKHKDVLLFEVKMKVNKYKETFYINAIQVGMKTVDIVIYNSFDEAYRELDSIIEETIQESLF